MIVTGKVSKIIINGEISSAEDLMEVIFPKQSRSPVFIPNTVTELIFKDRVVYLSPSTPLEIIIKKEYRGPLDINKTISQLRDEGLLD